MKYCEYGVGSEGFDAELVARERREHLERKTVRKAEAVEQVAKAYGKIEEGILELRYAQEVLMNGMLQRCIDDLNTEMRYLEMTQGQL